jgi:hypothetical protein
VPGSRWSTVSLAAVIQASVLTGSISEMEATQVVLPTPNPPAMTIFPEPTAVESGEVEKAIADSF